MNHLCHRARARTGGWALCWAVSWKFFLEIFLFYLYTHTNIHLVYTHIYRSCPLRCDLFAASTSSEIQKLLRVPMYIEWSYGGEPCRKSARSSAGNHFIPTPPYAIRAAVNATATNRHQACKDTRRATYAYLNIICVRRRETMSDQQHAIHTQHNTYKCWMVLCYGGVGNI